MADAECSVHKQSLPTCKGWYKVQVMDSNSNAPFTLKDGQNHRLYPVRLKLMRLNSLIMV